MRCLVDVVTVVVLCCETLTFVLTATITLLSAKTFDYLRKPRHEVLSNRESARSRQHLFIAVSGLIMCSIHTARFVSWPWIGRYERRLLRIGVPLLLNSAVWAATVGSILFRSFVSPPALLATSLEVRLCIVLHCFILKWLANSCHSSTHFAHQLFSDDIHFDRIC